MNADTAYLFRHALLREAAYQLQMPADRARLHGLAFAAMEASAGGRAPEPPPLRMGEEVRMAAHASDPFAGEMAERAQRAQTADGADGPSLLAACRLYLRRAAEHADRHFLNGASAGLWERLSEVLEGDGRSESLCRAASANRNAGKVRAAWRCLRRARDVDREAGQRRREAFVLSNLAVLCRDTDRPRRAEALLRSALAIHREEGDRRAEAISLGRLANVHGDSGRYDEAERGFGEAIALLRAEGDRGHLATTLGNLARLLFLVGRGAEAEHLLEEALALHRNLGDRRFEGIVLSSLGDLYRQTGRTDEAGRVFAARRGDRARPFCARSETRRS